MFDIISINIITSLLVYFASIGYGSAISSLGAGLPELSEILSISESICGQLFAFRGLGYLLGSLISSQLSNQVIISKYNIVAYSIYLSGLSTALFALTTNFILLKFIILFQGLGFALIDVFGAVCLCELWGDKVQPWIQIRSATCSFGAVIGPLLIGHLGFRLASLLVGGICGMTVIFQILVYLKLKSVKESLTFDSESNHSNRNNQNNHDTHGFESNNSNSNSNSNNPTMPPSLYQYSLLHGSGLLNDQQNSTVTCPHQNTIQSTTWYLAFCSSERLILIILSTIMLIFHGVYYVANGWIPTYSLLSEITDSRSKAASLLSAYSSALMTGSSLSAIFSIYIPREWILRILFTTLGAASLILVLCQGNISYYPLLGCVIIMGFSIGPMYGMILTLPAQLNIVMNSEATSSIVFGGCIGESLLPVFVGWCIGKWGSQSFPWSMLLMLISMVILYLTASLISSTSHQSFKKPWKGLKLSIRNISVTSKQKKAKSNPQEDSNSDEDNDIDESRGEEDEEETELILRGPLEN